MNGKKQILMIMPVLKNGGAEKVAALLLNEFDKNGCGCELVLTNSERNEVVDRGLNSDITLTILREKFQKNNSLKKLFIKLFRLFASLICKIPELMKKKVPAEWAYLSFKAQYYDELKALKKVISDKPEATIISFLQPSIPLTLLASKGLPNRVVISERADPYRLLKKRYGYNFIKKYYRRADAVVFQTNDAMTAYPENISKKGTVIFNPISDDLPEPYFGERNKNITTFCRISKQKNLPMLAEAFSVVHRDFPEYRLRIIGQPNNDDDIIALNETKAVIEKHDLTEFVDFLPFSKNVHGEIIKDAVYVNSSDYEGMSNAMLEAMAIGMPVICTDCPIGGARAVIKDGENGLLTPVGDSNAMSSAIKQILSDKELSCKLSRNASKVRNEMSLTNTAKLWLEILQ